MKHLPFTLPTNLLICLLSCLLLFSCSKADEPQKKELPPVEVEEVEVVEKAELISFMIGGQKAAVEGDGTMLFCMPLGTDVTSLKPEFVVKGMKVKVGGKEQVMEVKVLVGGKEQVSGVSIVNFTSPVTYTMVASGPKEVTTSKSEEVITWTVRVYCFDLPVIFLYSKGKSPINSKDVWMDGGSMKIWTAEEGVEDLGNLSVRGRGNTTWWSYPKKPYTVKFEKKKSVLGMPKDKRWNLLANWMDRTGMRNAVAFEVARQTGLAWTPHGRFVELFLNDAFQGTYYICEHIKIAEDRVDIAEMTVTDVSGDAVTGGYLLELDAYYDEVYKFRPTRSGLPFMLKSPDEHVQDAQLTYIYNYITEVEKRLYASDFPGDGSYRELLDVDSFADWWLIYELCLNEEPKHPKSCYMYKDRGGKLFAGPVWDFDWETFRPGFTNMIDDHHIWYGRLFRDPYFVQRVQERWAELKPAFESVGPFIDSTAAELAYSDKSNIAMWPINSWVNGDERMSFDQSVSRLKSAYLSRIKALDAELR